MACAALAEKPNWIQIRMSSAHIIIVNYNAGDWLRRSLKSVLDFGLFNVTVVDNCSVDDSVVNAKQHFAGENRLNWIENSENRGFAAANNQVLAELSTEFAVLLNPDCEINQFTLQLMLDAFNAYPEIGLASCRILNEDGSLQRTCRRQFPTPWSALVRMLQLHRLFPNNPKFVNFDYGDSDIKVGEIEFVEAISGAFMVVRKSAMDDVGLLDEEYFMHCEDLDWCKRFAQHGWKVAFVSDASVVHAKGVSSASRPTLVLWTLHKGMNRFFDKFYKNQNSLLLRWVVKLGIVASFVLRWLVSLLNRISRISK